MDAIRWTPRWLLVTVYRRLKRMPAVSKSKSTAVHDVLATLGWPIVYGLSATAAFYFFTLRGPLDLPNVNRYFAAHPVSFLATGMFFVGAAALILKLRDVLRNASVLNEQLLPDPPTGGQRVGEAMRLLEHLSQLSEAVRDSYLGRRLRDGLQFVTRRGMADEIDDELKYLADQDLTRQHNSFALVRIIIWATPMLGFLGTVIGVAQALGNLDASELASNADTAMEKLLSGLYVAFDTTALALCLSIVLMFIQFFVDRLETQVLDETDLLATAQLSGRFQQFAGRLDPYVVPIERMSQAVIQSSEQLVGKQVSLWQSTLGEMQQQWHQMMSLAGDSLRDALSTSLDNSLESHATRLAELERTATAEADARWQKWNGAIAENADCMTEQRDELVRQGELMKSAVDAVGDIINLEKSLNDNLNTLAGAKHFEEAVSGLSAAIQLLGSQVGRNHRESTVKLPGVAERVSQEEAAELEERVAPVANPSSPIDEVDDSNSSDSNSSESNSNERAA